MVVCWTGCRRRWKHHHVKIADARAKALSSVESLPPHGSPTKRGCTRSGSRSMASTSFPIDQSLGQTAPETPQPITANCLMLHRSSVSVGYIISQPSRHKRIRNLGGDKIKQGGTLDELRCARRRHSQHSTHVERIDRHGEPPRATGLLPVSACCLRSSGKTAILPPARDDLHPP